MKNLHNTIIAGFDHALARDLVLKLLYKLGFEDAFDDVHRGYSKHSAIAINPKGQIVSLSNKHLEIHRDHGLELMPYQLFLSAYADDTPKVEPPTPTPVPLIWDKFTENLRGVCLVKRDRELADTKAKEESDLIKKVQAETEISPSGYWSDSVLNILDCKFGQPIGNQPVRCSCGAIYSYGDLHTCNGGL